MKAIYTFEDGTRSESEIDRTPEKMREMEKWLKEGTLGAVGNKVVALDWK